MFTSRAEYRLMMREDNADLRLTGLGYELGIVGEDIAGEIKERQKRIDSEIKRVKTVVVKPTETVNLFLKEKGSNPINNGVHLSQILKRAEMDYGAVENLAKSPEEVEGRIARQVEIQIKYEGYIERQLSEINKFKSLEKIKIPVAFNFKGVHGLSNELKEKLIAVQPLSLGQASRVDGITPAAISVLMVALKNRAGA